jgi:hypothetical protein
VGLRAVQVLEAMYRSHHEKKAVQVKQGWEFLSFTEHCYALQQHLTLTES